MKKKNLTVFQSNKFTESRQEFSLNEKRVLQYVIANIKPTDTEFKQYVIPITNIAELADISPKNMYSFGKDLMKTMLSKFIILEDPKNLRLKGFNYFERLEYYQGDLTIQLHQEVHHLFLEIQKSKKGFTAYELTEFMTLTSTYAQRIYELMKQYSRSKQRERTIEIADLREMFGLDPKKYKLFSDFRKRVLELSHKMIEKETSLRYKWETLSVKGRKVTAIRFYQIHIAGKEVPTELQEREFLNSYIDEEIHNEEFNTYLTIREIYKESDDSYWITDKFDGIAYKYHSISEIQTCIAKAITQKGLDLI